MRRGGGVERIIAGSFLVSLLASIGFGVTYVLGGQTQFEGLFVGLAVAGLAVGLIVWGKELMPPGPYVEEREPHSTPRERAAFEAEYEWAQDVIPRRRLLGRLLVGAAGALGLAALLPIRSLGSPPGESLLATEWEEGALVVDSSGKAITRFELQDGGVLTVFPEGAEGSADSQTVLIKLSEEDAAQLRTPPEWTPDGYVAYSKICTHAGCPVGLYEKETKELFCPCHQSVFDVLDRARAVAGPATRPLPQLRLEIDDSNQLRAQGDFIEPVGPGFWNLDA